MNVVVVSVNKVQTFLYHIVRGYASESETEDLTLKTVQNASFDISERFLQILKEEFHIDKDDEILSISGKIYFYSSLPKEVLEKKLQKIFTYFYLHYRGQVQIKYTYFQAEKNDGKLHLIQKCGKILKSTACENQMIIDNQKILFQFPQKGYRSKVESEYKENSFAKINFGDVFVSGLDDLLRERTDEEMRVIKDTNIAVIKADLDNMGTLFRAIKDYDVYTAVSRNLDQKISLKYIAEKLKSLNERGEYGTNGMRIFPFYAAGDDIFFAVSVGDIFNGIKLMENILDDINSEIQSYGKQFLKLSVGIEITKADQPIRFYSERVEKELKLAKRYGRGREDVKMSIALDDMVYPVYKEGTGENDWNDLVNDIRLLNVVKKRKKEMMTSYFNHILSAVTEVEDGNDVVYANTVFYWLRPTSSEIKAENYDYYKDEIVIRTILMRQLAEEKEDKENFKCKYRIHFSEENKKRFEKRIRLFLMFSDNRYDARLGGYGELDGYVIGQVDFADTKYVNKYYIAPVIEYVFEKNLQGNLRTVFITRKLEEREKKKVISYYKIKINKSMLFKMKKLLVQKERRDAVLERICEMLERENAERPEAEHAFKTKQFSKDNFMLYAEELDGNYIDSLLNFYAYKNISAIKNGRNIRKKIKKEGQGYGSGRKYRGNRKNDNSDNHRF